MDEAIAPDDHSDRLIALPQPSITLAMGVVGNHAAAVGTGLVLTFKSQFLRSVSGKLWQRKNSKSTCVMLQHQTSKACSKELVAPWGFAEQPPRHLFLVAVEALRHNNI